MCFSVELSSSHMKVKEKVKKKRACKGSVTHMANQGKLPKLPTPLSHHKLRGRRSISDKQQ